MLELGGWSATSMDNTQRLNTLKIAIIGWDAATFDVALPLVEAGHLPELGRLMHEGGWGPLRSTRHPISPTAWASLMTGTNPGKHGIFDFVGLQEDGRFRALTGGALGAKTLWAHLSDAGRRVAVVNVPMTYPPEAVNGFVISGMDAPQQDRAFTHPIQLEAELYERFGGYREGVRARGRIGASVERFTSDYVDQTCDVTRLHGDVACYLLDTHSVEFLMVVFTGPDRVQHALGHLLGRPPSPSDGIGRVYRACDNVLERITKRLDDSWVTIVMSDHGACAYRRVFELSTWLAQRGWLRLRSPSRGSQLSASLAAGWRRLGRLMGHSVTVEPHLAQFMSRIVWEETEAFALGAFGSIYVNTCDRFPKGIVKPGEHYEAVCEQIASELLSARDPETGAPMVYSVHRSVDVYEGPFAHLAPDLLIETTDEYFVRNNLDQETNRLTYPAGRYQGRSLAHTAKHTEQGILVASGGPFVTGSHQSDARIIDLAPTVLHLSGLPLPAEMDGKPLLDWLDSRYCEKHPVQWSDTPSVSVVAERTTWYDGEDEAAVESRLRDLGYLD